VARGDGNWNWIRVQGNHGDNLYMGSDGGNRGIWADGNRDLNLYNKGINALSVKQNGDVSLNRSGDVAGDARVGGNLVMKGDNQWIIHTPHDGRKTMYIAPLANGAWNWNNQTRFEKDGKVRMRQLCINDNPYDGSEATCLNQTQLLKLKSILGEGAPQALTASSIRFPAANNTWSIQPESGVAFVVRDNTSGGDKRHAFWKNRYRDA
jgi:hypothetical protein